MRDRVADQEVLVTYCTASRTGRAFARRVDGRSETFRLVATDHFNAMLEDRTTGSWTLTAINASQAFWHSRRTVQPGTERY